MAPDRLSVEGFLTRADMVYERTLHQRPSLEKECAGKERRIGAENGTNNCRQGGTLWRVDPIGVIIMSKGW